MLLTTLGSASRSLLAQATTPLVSIASSVGSVSKVAVDLNVVRRRDLSLFEGSVCELLGYKVGSVSAGAKIPIAPVEKSPPLAW
jgi:hypothetical protein